MSIRSTTILLYGATDVGKSSQLGEMAKWEFAKTGRISRLISADSGWQPLEGIVETPERPLGTKNPDGSTVCVQAWNVQGLRDPWVVLIELSEGAWPILVSSPLGPKIKMLKPTWISANGGNYISVKSGEKSFQVGQYLIEGLSTLATTGMQDHINSARKLSQDVVGTFESKITETSLGGQDSERRVVLASASMSHYGQVQRFLLDDLVPRFGHLSVDRVVWTAHEARGTDDISGMQNSVLGPATVGKAVVDKTTHKFGHTFHMTVETEIKKDPKTGASSVNRDFRAWFISHPDGILTKMLWPAKVSLPITKAQELLRKYPGGFIPLSSGSGTMAQFLDFMSLGEGEK